jgi:cation diffusion facilitator family transporter
MASGSKKVIIAALIGNTLIAVTKFVAASITGSSAMMSEGIHSLVDTGNQALLLYGMKRAKKPADKYFPFGHGKEMYFWSFVVSILIFAVGAGVSLYEGIHHIMHPVVVKSYMVNYIVLGLAILFEGGALWLAVKEFVLTKGNKTSLEAVKHGKDPALFVVLFEDTAAMLGLIFALAGVALAQLTGNPIWDGVASVCIGIILGITAIWLAYETKGLLIGESAHTELTDAVRVTLKEDAHIHNIGEVLSLHMGPEFVLVIAAVDFKDSLNADDIEKAIVALKQSIKKQHPIIKRIFIEARSTEL